MKLKKGRIYRAKACNRFGPNGLLGDSWLWVYEGQVPHYENHSFKSVVSGRPFFTSVPHRWLEEAEDEGG